MKVSAKNIQLLISKILLTKMIGIVLLKSRKN